MNEFEFINSIKQQYYRQSTLIKGIGDDGAIISGSSDRLVVVTDTMVENVHFSLKYMTYSDVGYRVMAANLSDLAAMGCKPQFYLLNIVAPKNTQNSSIIEIVNGTKELANRYNMDLIGGDTVEGEHLVITVTAIGSQKHGLKRLRSDALEDDVVFCTGYLGKSAYGLELIKNNQIDKTSEFIQSHIRPNPRCDFVKITSNIKRICLNDISDGIASELYEIAEASDVDIEIDWDELPINHQMKQLNQHQLMEYVLYSGEDFELVGTCSAVDWIQIEKICLNNNINISKIGKVRRKKDAKPNVTININEKLQTLERKGFRHGSLD